METERIKRPVTVTIALGMILVNALFWLVFGIITLAGAHPALPDSPGAVKIIAVLAFAAALVFFGLVYFLNRKNRFAYFFTMVCLGFVALLTITDDFGLADLFILVLNLVPLGLLLKEIAWFQPSQPTPAPD